MWEVSSKFVWPHARGFLDALGCDYGAESVRFILLPLFRRKLGFQNTISDTERYQRIAYIWRWTANFFNNKLQVPKLHATPIHLRDQKMLEKMATFVYFHTRYFLDVLRCYDDTKGVLPVLLPLLGGQFGFQSAILDQRVGDIRPWAVSFLHNKLQASKRHATPIRRSDQGGRVTMSNLVLFNDNGFLRVLGSSDGVEDVHPIPAAIARRQVAVSEHHIRHKSLPANSVHQATGRKFSQEHVASLPTACHSSPQERPDGIGDYVQIRVFNCDEIWHFGVCCDAIGGVQFHIAGVVRRQVGVSERDLRHGVFPENRVHQAMNFRFSQQ